MVTSEQLKKIKLILTDIDGVLTDGKVGYGAEDFIKFFNYSLLQSPLFSLPGSS